MRYRLLGPLQVVRTDSSTQVDVGPRKQRAVLAALLLARGRVVSVNRLIDAVWGEDVPASATAGLQAYVSNLRRALRDGAATSPIVRQAPGYYLETAPDEVDLAVFGATAARAQAAVDEGRWEAARTEADAALSSWRGHFLEDLRDEPWVLPEATRAEEMRWRRPPPT